MCGIVGLVGVNDQALVRRMNERLHHRGPDDSGEYHDDSQRVALAMRRLSIIDLAHGHQPMANEDNSLLVVCNGEIYNSPELRDGLKKRGHYLKTRNSDIEVLLHLYEEQGTDLLSVLNGMYAFVLYDKRHKILFGARDRVGIKPFYYGHKEGKFVFASELKSLLLAPWIARDLDPTSLSHYLSLQFIPAPATIFRDIKKLPAGHFFIYKIGESELTVQPYWHLPLNPQPAGRREERVAVIREEMRQAVKRWTLSDVPVACSLSGGLDSSGLVAFLAQSGIKDLRTYSLGFEGEDDQGCNELPLARLVAEKWGTQHHEVVLNPQKLLTDLDRMVWHLDEPYGGGLPSWYIYELIARDVKVCLTGTGGDELFGNYSKSAIFQRPLWYRQLKNVKDSWQQKSWPLLCDGWRFPQGHFFPRYFADAQKKQILAASVPAGLETEALLNTIWQKARVADVRDAVAVVDFQLQLPEEFLAVTDRFSMAHSLEARVPFLDHNLIEQVFQLPAAWRADLADPKGFMKSVVGDYLPEQLLRAPKKGFILPLRQWTRGCLKAQIESLLSPDYLKQQGLFSVGLYRDYVRPHLEGRQDFTQQIWTVFMFQLWQRKFYEDQ